MMTSHFEEVRERGEPTSALWASDSGIYRRFGYGVASWLSENRIDRGDTDFAVPANAPGRCRMLDKDEAQALMPAVYDEVWRERPGMMARNEAWWRTRILRDAPHHRRGGTPFRRVVYEEDGHPRGYLLYRTRDAGRKAQTIVHELTGVDGAATRALHEIACAVDLVDEVVYPNAPIDDVLPHLLADSRELKRRVRDALWVRLMDVPAALAGRAYSAEGRIRFDVHDDFLPDNTGAYELEASAGGAKCQRTSAVDGDIALDVADLGAAFLGGASFRTLARAGRVRGDAAALERADALFAWDPLPWNAELF
jgi:predicted acetyltransferase